MLEQGDLKLAQTCNLMLTIMIVGTVMCMRVNELDQLQNLQRAMGL